jgi:hypothetical protein
MSAMSQVHAEDRIARLAGGKIHCHVGLRSGMRLDIGVLGAEQLFGAINGQLLSYVDKLATTVIALRRIAFRVLVRQHGTLHFEHSFADKILRGNELQAEFLPLGLMVDRSGNIGIIGTEHF